MSKTHKNKIKERILASKIKSLYDENYENLERGQKYELVLKKSLELIEFANEHNVSNYMEYTYLIGFLISFFFVESD